jgi:hypothetical protein
VDHCLLDVEGVGFREIAAQIQKNDLGHLAILGEPETCR